MAKRVFLDENYIAVDLDNGSELKYFQKGISFVKINDMHYQLYGGEFNQGDYQTFLISDSANWYAEDGTTAYSSTTLKDFLLTNTGAGSALPTQTGNEVVVSSDSAILTRPSNYAYEVAGGLRSGKSVVNKFAINTDIDTETSEIVASWGGAFDPTSDIMTTAQTFNITYNGTTDGESTTGALSLLFTYLDSSFEQATAMHTLGTDGSDTTSFSGLGINRIVVLSNGGSGHNVNDITVTATTDGTTQAQIPALTSVTQQSLFHTPISTNLYLDWLFAAAAKTSGGGSNPQFEIKGYSWSRVTLARYLIFQAIFDSQRQSFLEIRPSQAFTLGGREVVWFEVETDTNNTQVELRYSGSLESTT